MENKFLKTGTTTLGIVCKDAVILAADKKMTLGGAIVATTKTDKIVEINKDIAVTTAGLVSDIQLLIKVIRAQIKLNDLRTGRKIKVKEAANLLASLVYNNIRKMSMVQGVTGFLLAGKDTSGVYLYELGMDGSLTLYDDYTCDGSGMMFAMGVLEAYYKKDMSIEDAKELAVKAINSAMQRDTASGGGVDVVVITKKELKRLPTRVLSNKLN